MHLEVGSGVDTWGSRMTLLEQSKSLSFLPLHHRGVGQWLHPLEVHGAM